MNAVHQSAEFVVSPFIEGRASSSDSKVAVEVVNPSIGRPIFEIPAGCDSDVDRAVTAARRSFASESWSGAAPSHRKRVLHRFAELIETDASNLDRLDAAEMGKPVRISSANSTEAAELMRFNAE